MIRKRNFILFLVALVFLVSGLTATLANEFSANGAESAALPDSLDSFNQHNEQIRSATSPDSTPDREAIRSRLQAKLAAGEGSERAEPILTSVDQTTPMPTQTSAGSGVQVCPTEEPVTLTELSWPQQVSFDTSEGARRVVSGDGTLLMQLPVTSSRNAADTCLGSDVVGVSINGDLLNNYNAANYSSYTSEQQIGYARDGFPIYGAADNPENLDSCGGVNTGSGYAYYLQPNNGYIIACYAGTPAPFVE